jgi:hypothetical protein
MKKIARRMHLNFRYPIGSADLRLLLHRTQFQLDPDTQSLAAFAASQTKNQ